MSQRILHIVPHLDPSGVAKQLAMVSLGLPRDAFTVEVGVLSNDCGLDWSLRQAGIPVHVLGPTRRLDLVSLWKLRRLMRSFQPHVIHAWGPAAWRSIALAQPGHVRSVVAGRPLAGAQTRLPIVDRLLLARAACIVARGQAEATHCLEAGLPADRIRLVPPGVDNSQRPASSGIAGVPASARVILCAGPLEAHHGFRDAIWSLEILLFLFDDLHLLLAGAGPERIRLERFAVRNRMGDRVHFLGARADVPALLARSEMVWLPRLSDGGMQLALEAMAAGKPVIATAWPSLREIITDGATGFLITPGDKVALARRTTELLRNPELARRLGEAGRRHAEAFSPALLVERCARLYAELAQHFTNPPAKNTSPKRKRGTTTLVQARLSLTLRASVEERGRVEGRCRESATGNRQG